MYKTMMTDAANLGTALTRLENDGNAICYVLPHLENTTTLYVIVYRPSPYRVGNSLA